MAGTGDIRLTLFLLFCAFGMRFYRLSVRIFAYCFIFLRKIRRGMPFSKNGISPRRAENLFLKK